MAASDVYDVAIVGGGVSGVYSAWRIITNDPHKKVAVFEASGDVGGRLLSAKPPGLPRVCAELGGMRILKDVQPRITTLIAKLGIETYPFPVGEPSNIAYLRGVHLRYSEFLQAPDKVPYRLTFQERGKTPGQIVIDAIEQIVPGVTAMSDPQRREAVKTAKFDGQPLYKQGFWQLLFRVMSGEAYDLAVAAGGYQTTMTSWNAADAIPWFLTDFGVNAEYLGFVNGFQEVPLKLADLFKKAGGSIEFNVPVESFEQQDGGLIEINFVCKRNPVLARQLILAMPRRSLELLKPTGVVMGNERARELIASVTPRPLFKLFTAYEDPWWLAAGADKGRSTTDLPVRQTYYWPGPNGTTVTSGKALLMASYDDGDNIGFWDGLRGKRSVGLRATAGTEASADFEPFVGDEQYQDEGSAEWRENKAPRGMVEEVQRQLQEIHALEYLPRPYTASFKDWGADPFGGGWNSWNIGVKSWNVEKEILQPVKDVPVFICGEAYSREQGWVEGALDTADQMLSRHFCIEPLSN